MPYMLIDLRKINTLMVGGSSLFYNTSDRHQQYEYDTDNTSDTRATQLRHNCNTSTTRTTQVRHECDTSEKF